MAGCCKWQGFLAGQQQSEASAPGSTGAAKAPPPVQRRRMYCYKAPSDNLLVALGKWMDAAIPLMPNRYRALLAAGHAGVRDFASEPACIS